MILSFQKIYDDAQTVTAVESEFQFYYEKFKTAYLSKSLKESLISETGVGAVDRLEQNDPFGAWEHMKRAGLELERTRQSDSIKRGNIKDSADERFEKYLDNQKNPNKAYGLLTGFKPLDDATHGLKGGEVLVIAGRPGSGKSISSLVIGKNAYKAGKNVLFVSIEMPKEQVELRFDASYTGLETDKIELGKLEPEKEAQYKAALDEN
jgi:replicative DNA helicase